MNAVNRERAGYDYTITDFEHADLTVQNGLVTAAALTQARTAAELTQWQSAGKAAKPEFTVKDNDNLAACDVQEQVLTVVDKDTCIVADKATSVAYTGTPTKFVNLVANFKDAGSAANQNSNGAYREAYAANVSNNPPLTVTITATDEDAETVALADVLMAAAQLTTNKSQVVTLGDASSATPLTVTYDDASYQAFRSAGGSIILANVEMIDGDFRLAAKSGSAPVLTYAGSTTGVDKSVFAEFDRWYTNLQDASLTFDGTGASEYTSIKRLSLSAHALSTAAPQSLLRTVGNSLMNAMSAATHAVYDGLTALVKQVGAAETQNTLYLSFQEGTSIDSAVLAAVQALQTTSVSSATSIEIEGGSYVNGGTTLTFAGTNADAGIDKDTINVTLTYASADAVKYTEVADVYAHGANSRQETVTVAPNGMTVTSQEIDDDENPGEKVKAAVATMTADASVSDALDLLDELTAKGVPHAQADMTATSDKVAKITASDNNSVISSITMADGAQTGDVLALIPEVATHSKAVVAIPDGNTDISSPVTTDNNGNVTVTLTNTNNLADALAAAAAVDKSVTATVTARSGTDVEATITGNANGVTMKVEDITGAGNVSLDTAAAAVVSALANTGESNITVTGLDSNPGTITAVTTDADGVVTVTLKSNATAEQVAAATNAVKAAVADSDESKVLVKADTTTTTVAGETVTDTLGKALNALSGSSTATRAVVSNSDTVTNGLVAIKFDNGSEEATYEAKLLPEKTLEDALSLYNRMLNSATFDNYLANTSVAIYGADDETMVTRVAGIDTDTDGKVDTVAVTGTALPDLATAVAQVALLTNTHQNVHTLQYTSTDSEQAGQTITATRGSDDTVALTLAGTTLADALAALDETAVGVPVTLPAADGSQLATLSRDDSTGAITLAAGSGDDEVSVVATGSTTDGYTGTATDNRATLASVIAAYGDLLGDDGLSQLAVTTDGISNVTSATLATDASGALTVTLTVDETLADDALDALVSGSGTYTLVANGQTYAVVAGAIQRQPEPTPSPSPAPSPTPTPTPVPAPSNNSSSSSSGSNGGGSSSSSASNDAKPTGCDSWTPVGTPDLFQIDRQGTTATIYFTPVSDYTDRYHVVFGNQEGEEKYGGIAMQVDAERNRGVLAIDIAQLDPGAQYSFKVAPVNGCAVGTWSNWLTAKPVSRYGRSAVKTYRYAGK